MAWLKRISLLMLLSLGLCQGMRSQGMRYDNFVIKPMNTGGLISVSGALITVCTSAGTGTPCTPKVANIYSDEALTTPIVGTGGAGTTNSDSGGNFGFYAAPGSYIITVTGAGITSYTIKLVLPVGIAAATFGGPSPWYDITSPIYGAKCDGVTDDTTAVQAALTAANAVGGGTVSVPPGKTCIIASSLDMHDMVGVTLNGLSGNNSGLANIQTTSTGKPQLKFTGSASPLINLKSTQQVFIQNIVLLSSNAAFTGTFIDTSHSASLADSDGDHFKNLMITGTSTAKNATCLLSLDQTIVATVDNVFFEWAKTGLCGQALATSYSNIVTVNNSVFSGVNGTLSVSGITGFGSNWILNNDTFELTGVVGTYVPIDMSLAGCISCSFQSIWISDGSNAFAGTEIKLGIPSGIYTGLGSLSITGSFFAGGSTHLATLMTVASAVTGLSFTGNTVAAFANGFVFTGSNQTGIQINGNTLSAITTLLTGTPASGQVCDTSNFCNNYGITQYSNSTNSPGFFDGSGTDLFRQRCGGTVPGCLVYSSSGGTGTNGIWAIRNNNTDNTESFRVTTATQTTAITNGTVSGNFTPSQTNGIVGTTTNNNANAGSVGEYVTATVATGASVTLATGVTSNVTSISLTAGDWDVTGAVDFTFGATTSYTNLIGSVSSTSATIGGQDSKFDFETPAAVPTAGADSTFPLPVVRFSLSGTTTVFLVAQGTFTVSTLKAYGTIRARRIR